MSRFATFQINTFARSRRNSGFAAIGGFATLALRITGTNIEEKEHLDASLSAALLSQNDWRESPVITSTPFLPNTEMQNNSLLRIMSYIFDYDENEVLSLSRYYSSREELTPSIVCTAKSDVQDGGLQLRLAVRDATQDWITSSYTTSDMVVELGRTLYLTTTDCQHLVCKVSLIFTVRWSLSVLVPANEAATNNIFLSIPSPTIELEVNGITTSTIITTSSNTSFPSYIVYDVTPMKQDDESSVVKETLIIVSWAMYYKPTNDTFISSTTMELMESPTLQMKKNANTMRLKTTLLTPVTTAERVTSTIGSELHIQQSATSMDRQRVPQDSVLLAAEKALDRQDKLEEELSGNSRPKPPPWPNKALFGAYTPQFDDASTHTDTDRFSITPTISPLASPSTSPTTSTPSESFSAIIPTVNKHCMTTTRTISSLINSAAPRYGRVSSEKSHTTSTPSEVPILPPPSVHPTSCRLSPYRLTRVSITRQSHPDDILSIGLKVPSLEGALLRISPYFFQAQLQDLAKGRQICSFTCKNEGFAPLLF